jgi:hypothetical protein
LSAFWPIIKEAAGFAGAVLVAIPWMLDFRGRKRKGRVAAVKATGSLRGVRDELIAEDETWLSKAKPADLYCTLGGLALIALSFLIGLFLVA